LYSVAPSDSVVLQ